jgi:hypothetical protein
MEITNFGKGAIPTPKAIRDTQYRIMAATSLAAIDWVTPYTVENGFLLRQRDQKSSSSCTAQATGYYTEALMRIEKNLIEEYSNRYVYSQVYVPGGGAYIWKAMSIPLKGAASAISVPDGDSRETTMRDTSLNVGAIIEARTDKYAVIPRSNIDQMATVVRDYHGFVTGFNGSDDMFSGDGTLNIPSSPPWGHAIYVCGHQLKDHIGRNGEMVHPNEKTLKAKASWNGTFAGYHYIPECFVNSGFLFDCYTYAAIEDIDPNSMTQGLTDTQLNDLWMAAFRRAIDPTGLAFYRGKSFDVVIKDILGSKEMIFYGGVDAKVKEMENAIRSGQF